ncbi:MAG TPA: N-acetyl-alpha-D-glucosaminyl L-malate synthase BshA [Thermoanaerobaculia bacterium]|nr:N-acetyl-alpha-D-glucosaminyl L-malate synthase BshA [Thermoanaerobaculia bacterium]
MRIGISCYPTYGGSGVVATELAMALAARGDQVHVISYALPSRLSGLCGSLRGRDAEVPTELYENLHYHEVVVPHYPLFEYPPYELALSTKMVEVARREQLDLLHVHYAVPNAVSAILARQIVLPQRLPVVTTLHGTDITLVGNDPNYLETTRFGILESDGVTAVSRWLAEKTHEKIGVSREIEVIPNFIDPERYERATRQPGARRWAAPGERVLVHISNFRPVKRVQDVVETFYRVQQKVPARLLLVGDGPDRPKVDQRCRELGICGAITFIGNLPLVEEVLLGADLFLLPSDAESFGLAALEAMACKVPVIGARAGGLPEVVTDGEDGYLLPVADVDGMAEAALSLLQEPARLRRFGEAARRNAVERFEQERVVEQYRQLYLRILD